MTPYATVADLEVYLGDRALPDEPDRLVLRASELVAGCTFSISSRLDEYVDSEHPLEAYEEALRDATCAQVEYWLEWGEEFDIANPQGSIAISRLQISRLPPKLALRAYRILRSAGLLSSAVAYSR